MGALDDLKAAGFSDAEIGTYAGDQRHALLAGGFSDREINGDLGAAPKPEPDMAAGNKTFARTLASYLAYNPIKAAATVLNAFTGAGQTAREIAKDAVKFDVVPGTENLITGPQHRSAAMEAALNAGTGLLFGFPAYIGASLGGLTSKYLLGMDADPKELAETISKFVTYTPRTEAGQRLVGNIALPLAKLQQVSENAGHWVSDVSTNLGASTNASSTAGAITDQTLQVLPMILLGELGRKMGGQTVTGADMKNVSTVIAGEGAAPEMQQSVEDSLRAIYDKTGIGPYTVAKEAAQNPELHADLLDPNVAVPKEFEQFIKKPQEQEGARVQGEGVPRVDASAIEGGIPSDLNAGNRFSAADNEAYARMQAHALGRIAASEGVSERGGATTVGGNVASPNDGAYYRRNQLDGESNGAEKDELDFTRTQGMDAGGVAGGSRSVEAVLEPRSAAGKTVSGRDPAQGWARATRASREGRPLVLYRGANAPLTPEHFAEEALGCNTGHPSSGLGVWFTTKPTEAAKYGRLIQKFYLDIRNPRVMPLEEMRNYEPIAEAIAHRNELLRQGYDGIVFHTRNVEEEYRIHFVAFNPEQVIHAEHPEAVGPGAEVRRGSRH